MGISIREAKVEDAKRLLEIYTYYVENTAISFEIETPTIEEFKGRIERITKKYPYIVIEKDGVIEGYAYAGPLKERAAYDKSCEVTIYLDKDAKKCGLGRKLYEALEEKLKEKGMLNLYACIAMPITPDKYLTANSAEFHAHLGYKQNGIFHKCGRKFDTWYDMIWMEKIVGEHM